MISFGLSFDGAACDVGFGGVVKVPAYDDCSIDGGVELSVAAVVDAVASGRGARRCWDRTDPGKLGQRRFGLRAPRVVTEDGEDLRCRVGSDFI